MRWIIASLLVFSVSCAHSPDPEPVSEDKIKLVEQRLFENCGGDCWLDQCWIENRKTICDVAFSFAPWGYQRETLGSTSKALSKSGHRVWLCGKDSMGTTLTSAFFIGFGSGIAAAALGGGPSPKFFVGNSFEERTCL